MRLAAWLGWSSRPIPDAMWQQTLAQYPFLSQRSAPELQRLRVMTAQFLAHKEFTGAHGLVVTDAMAVAIAAQACLPVLHLGLKLYNDFKGIVVHPGAMLARRERRDTAGVVHQYNEALSGEAMQYGPVTLSWQDVAATHKAAELGHNVVIHEFIHKMDMRAAGSGMPSGCPPLPSRAAKATWQAVMQAAFETFRQQVTMAERFGAEPPWLNSYGATSPVEFFAVASEAYFMNRQRFAQDFCTVTALFDAYFLPNRPKTGVLIAYSAT